MNRLNCPLFKKFTAKLKTRGELDRKLRKIGFTDPKVRKRILTNLDQIKERS